MPSEELGPASVHVKSRGFGVSVTSDSSVVVESMPSRVDSIDTASFTREIKTSVTMAVHSAAAADDDEDDDDAVAVRNGGLESSTGTGNSDASIPVGPRVYPPSKPHQGSGRQVESLVRLKEELRNGVDR